MTGSTRKRFVTTLLGATALTIAVPVAQAQSPDAFERVVESQQEQQRSSFVGSPDAIDRAVAAAQVQQTQPALEARERALSERPIPTTAGPDAFERALITHADELLARGAAMLDRHERALMSRPLPSPEPIVTSSGGVDWGDFGLGAGVGIGLMLVLLGVVAGVLVLRRDDSRVTPA